MIPSPPNLNVLFQGKNSVSPNAWPGGALVPGDRNGAWLHDNEIVSVELCLCLSRGDRKGCWAGKPTAGGCCFPGSLALVFLEGFTSSQVG